MRTLSELLCVYETYRDIKKNTFNQYNWCIVSLEKHLGRVATTDDLNTETINRWLRYMRDVHSPYTCKSRRMTMVTLWRFAYEMEMCSAPVRHVRAVKTPDRCVSTLDAEQVQSILDVADNLRGKYLGFTWRNLMRTWIKGTLETSCRPADMIALQWIDLKASQGHIQIIQQKTGRRRRAMFSLGLMCDIAKWHGDCDGPVWPLGKNSIFGRKIQEISDAVGIKFTHTTLRKTAITDVEAQQPGAGWIFAGHSSPATTRQWYTDADRAYRDIPRPRF